MDNLTNVIDERDREVQNIVQSINELAQVRVPAWPRAAAGGAAPAPLGCAAAALGLQLQPLMGKPPQASCCHPLCACLRLEPIRHMACAVLCLPCRS